jgi:hypothetical protein
LLSKLRDMRAQQKNTVIFFLDLILEKYSYYPKVFFRRNE